jgi:hypothetical protein
MVGVVVYTCNPNYSGEGGRRISSLRLAWAKVVARPYLKDKITTKGLGLWLKR